MNTVDKQKLMEWIKNRRIALEGMVNRHTGYHKHHLSGQHSSLVDVEWELQEGRFDATLIPTKNRNPLLNEKLFHLFVLCREKGLHFQYSGHVDGLTVYGLDEQCKDFIFDSDIIFLSHPDGEELLDKIITEVKAFDPKTVTPLPSDTI